MPKKVMVNTRTGERRVINLPGPGKTHWRSEAEGGPLHPFAPREGDPAIDYDEPARSLIAEPLTEDEDLDLDKSWADPRVNPTAWKRNIIGTVQHAAAPDDGSGSGGGGTDPDLTTEPFIFSGGPATSAILVMLKETPANAAVPSGVGSTFAITVWVRDPGTHLWGATTTFNAGYDKVFGTGDFNGGELYIQVGNVLTNGNMLALVKEQF